MTRALAIAAVACALVVACTLGACSREPAVESTSSVAPASATTTSTNDASASKSSVVHAPDAGVAPVPDTIAEARIELDRRAARIVELEGRVRALQDERLAREREWLEYTQGIAKLSSLAGLSRVAFQPAPDAAATPGDAKDASATPIAKPDAKPVEPSADRSTAAEDDRLARERDVAIARSLRALFVAEEIAGLELLELGRAKDGSTGPVVIRLLDAFGRSTGSLCAERLRLEGSIAAHTLTLVLEDGYERRGGERVPFAAPPELDDAPAPGDATPATIAPRAGVRRVELAHVDPRRWIDAVPELFRAVDREPPPDDGRWDLLGLRLALNGLLGRDGASGTWRIASLGGVQGAVVRDVQLDQLDEDGRIERKLFADRLVVRSETRGVVVELLDGAVLRGDVKLPFLDGRYRIYLPRADVEEWRAAGVPGLSEPPERVRR